jgi:hypothetical protein
MPAKIVFFVHGSCMPVDVLARQKIVTSAFARADRPLFRIHIEL